MSLVSRCILTVKHVQPSVAKDQNMTVMLCTDGYLGLLVLSVAFKCHS